jgi:hypothetical protein
VSRVTLRARWVTLRSSLKMLISCWVTLRARWVICRWALGSDGGASDESDSNRGSDRHVDLSSDRASDSEARASDGSDSDSDAMEVPECLAACAALAPLWSLEVGETHGRAAVAAALLLVTAGCDAARSEGAARCVDSCGEEERAVAAAGLSEVAEEVRLRERKRERERER